MLGSICKLVETESPSGDFEGSRAVVDLLVEVAGTISEIHSVERIPVPDYGEHFRVLAFDGHADDTGPLERTEDVVKLYHHARKIAACFRLEPGEQSVGGASDGSFVAAFNVPVLTALGRMATERTPAHEHILILDIALRGALLAGLIASL